MKQRTKRQNNKYWTEKNIKETNKAEIKTNRNLKNKTKMKQTENKMKVKQKQNENQNENNNRINRTEK